MNGYYRPRMDERSFHAWLRRTEPPNAALVPLGDDAAVLPPQTKPLVWCCDTVAEGTHFVAGIDPVLIGHKAVARNLSDLAAMGAAPVGMLLALVLPRGCPDALPQQITQGARAAGALFSCPLFGGDTTTHDGGIVVNVSMLGRPMAEQALTRCGAVAGDVVVVTGSFGGSGLGRHLRITPRIDEIAALLELVRPSAMIDVSDGLLLDVTRLAEASGCGFELDADLVPVHDDALQAGGDAVLRACTEGEDFELLFTLPASAWAKLQAHWVHATPLTRVGVMTAGARRVVRGGAPWTVCEQGHVHR